jgi:hypothetical protein
VPRSVIEALAGVAERIGGSRGKLLHKGWLSITCSPMHASGAKARAELGWAPRAKTSREALQKLAEAVPTGFPNLGVGLLFGLFSLSTLATGGRLLGEASSELRGVESTVNFELTGAGGSTWNLRVSGGRGWFAPGLARDATSTVRMTTDTFVKMLRGELAHSTALMTGKVRVTGEGHARFMLGAIITGFRHLGSAGGIGGLIGRAFTRTILRAAAS